MWQCADVRVRKGTHPDGHFMAWAWPGWSEAITKKGQAGACGKNSRVWFGLESGLTGDLPRKPFECFYRRDPGS